MNFPNEIARMILTGQKTMTRRPVKPNEQRCGFRVGNPYMVKAKRETKGWLRVTSTGRELAGAITYEDAKAEGFNNIDAFKAQWTRIYSPMWVKSQEPDDAELVARFDSRYAERPVWVIGFKMDHDPDLYLAADMSRGDYTHSQFLAAKGEPRVTDPAVLHPLWRKVAQARWEEARGVSTNDTLAELDDLMARYESKARSLGVDVRNGLRVMVARHEETKRRARRDAA